MRTYRRKRNTFPIWPIFAAPVVLFGGVLLSAQMNQEFQSNSQQWGATAQTEIRAEIESASAQAQRNRAEQRLRSGVAIKVEQIQQGQQYGTLQPGDIIFDPTGTTAVIGKDLKVTDIARTTDTEEIREALGW